MTTDLPESSKVPKVPTLHCPYAALIATLSVSPAQRLKVVLFLYLKIHKNIGLMVWEGLVWDACILPRGNFHQGVKVRTFLLYCFTSAQRPLIHCSREIGLQNHEVFTFATASCIDNYSGLDTTVSFSWTINHLFGVNLHGEWQIQTHNSNTLYSRPAEKSKPQLRNPAF